MKDRIIRWYHPNQILSELPGETQRNYYLDNLKFILIILVVSSHFAMKLDFVNGINYLVKFIYIFHMPCFIFINGFLAKRMNEGGKLRVDKIMITFWMYLIFKIVNFVLSYLFEEEASLSLFRDRSAPWYLFSLCIWYLAIPVLERIKTKYLIFGSFLLGLLVGYLSSFGILFSLSRVFVFFPFFIIGFCISKEQLEEFLDKRYRIFAALILIITFLAIAIFWGWLAPIEDIIYGTSSYEKVLEGLYPYGILIRAAWYVLALVLSASLMLLVPRTRLSFSCLGERTLQVYMTHIWVRNVLVYIGFFAFVEEQPIYVSVLVLVGSVLLTFILSNLWLKKLFDFFMFPKLFSKVLK